MNRILLARFIVLLTAKSPFTLCLRLITLVAVLGFILHLIGLIWLIYTLIIIFLGGIIIVFVYTSSVNNSFKLKVKIGGARLLGLMILIISLAKGFTIREALNRPQEAVWSFLYGPSRGLVLFLGRVIIISLFIVVKLVQAEKGPLKI